MTSTNRTAVYSQLIGLIEGFNKAGIAITGETTFASDLALDSLTVMDLVTEIEDHFDITLPLNRLPDLETIDQLTDEVCRILAAR